MTDTLTMDQINAAQNNDLSAVEAVVSAMESRIQTVAQAEARRLNRDATYFTDEFAQEARIAVWEALPRFTGETVDDFFGFMHKTLCGVLKEAASEERNPGADRDALKIFATWVKRCGGDVALAEKMCQTVPPEGGRRLGRDRAHAARLAWQGTSSLDNTFGGDDEDDFTLTNTLASSLGIPEEFITSADISAEDKRQNHAIVHAVLDSMGALEASVLRGNFGIGGHPLFGYARNDNQDAEFAAFLGKTEKQIKTARAKGLMSFAKRYIPVVTNGDDEAAAGWWDAYQAERDRFRRTAA
jgi:hypothetical protein